MLKLKTLGSVFLGGLVCCVLLTTLSMATPVQGTLTEQGTFTVTGTTIAFCNNPITTPCPLAPGNWNVPGSGTGPDLSVYGPDPNGGSIRPLTQAANPINQVTAPLLFLTFNNPVSG